MSQFLEFEFFPFLFPGVRGAEHQEPKASHPESQGDQSLGRQVAKKIFSNQIFHLQFCGRRPRRGVQLELHPVGGDVGQFLPKSPRKLHQDFITKVVEQLTTCTYTYTYTYLYFLIQFIFIYPHIYNSPTGAST